MLLLRQSFAPVATRQNQTALYTMCWSLEIERAALILARRSRESFWQHLLNQINSLVSIGLTLWCPAFRRFFPKILQGFSEKKRLNARGFVQEFLRSGMLYRPGISLKRRGKSSSLHSKKIFCLGGTGFFLSDVISGGLLGHLGPLCLALGINH